VTTQQLIPAVLTVIALIGGMLGVWNRMEKRQERLASNMEHLQSQLNRIEMQFGPNGGGLREAVNNLTVTVASISDKVVKIGEDLARLSGEVHAQDK
jgi:hypothetical protein